MTNLKPSSSINWHNHNVYADTVTGKIWHFDSYIHSSAPTARTNIIWQQSFQYVLMLQNKVMWEGKERVNEQSSNNHIMTDYLINNLLDFDTTVVEEASSGETCLSSCELLTPACFCFICHVISFSFFCLLFACEGGKICKSHQIYTTRRLSVLHVLLLWCIIIFKGSQQDIKRIISYSSTWQKKSSSLPFYVDPSKKW